MKKVVLSALFILLVAEVAFLYSAKPVAAESSTPSGIKRVQSVLKERLENRQEKVAEKKEDIKAKLEERKEDKIERARKAVVARYNVHKKAVERAEKLLEKLQVRVDTAKAAGEDVNEAEKLMADAKTKLADAKTKLAGIESKKGAALDKASFLEIQQSFKDIRQDLHAIRQDAAKIISTLKGFNSATSSGKNPQKEGTSPASSSSTSK